MCIMASGNGKLAGAIFGAALITVIFAWWMSLAPWPLPANAPATEFSAYRAIEHIKQTALEPHPGGSQANEEVYKYIIGQLQAMGAEYDVQRPVLRRGGGRAIESVGAILARVPGTASTGALAVDAHFDSTPYGPGAADDLSGIAAMLEAIRALKAGPPLKNDTLFCFADKEEMGGPGGPGVFTMHPWFKDVRAVLGLETRGTSGPALMFETGPGNGFLVRQMAQSDSRPRATSIMFDFYDRMPFGSDFNHYKALGMPGLNVAYIDDFCNYHTKLDTPENVDLGSLQHHGQYTLGMARQLGQVPLENCSAPDATYFNVIGSYMVVYPRTWGWPLAAAAMALALAVIVYGFTQGRLSIGGMLAGIGVYLGSFVVAFALTAPLSYVIYDILREHALYRNNSFTMATLLIGIGIFVLFARLVRNRVRPQNLMAGTLIVWCAATVVLQVMLPGGAYATTWPLFFLAPGLLVLLLSRNADRPSDTALTIAAASALPAILILVPSFAMFSYAITALAAPGLISLILLVVALFLPQLVLIPGRQQVVTGAGIVLAGVITFAGAFATNTPSPDRPRQNCLAYGVNFDTGQAWWLSGDERLDSWMRNFFSDETPRVAIGDIIGHDEPFTYLRAAAPMPPFAKTVINVLEDRIEDGRRKLKLFVDSPRDAQEIRLHVTSNIEVFASKAHGIDLGAEKKGWHLNLETVPFDGSEIELEVEPRIPLTIEAREISFALPKIEGVPPRPDHMMCTPNRVLDRRRDLRSNHTYSVCTYTF